MSVENFFQAFVDGKIKTRSYNNYHIIGNKTKIVIKTENLNRSDSVSLVAIKFPNGIVISNLYECPAHYGGSDLNRLFNLSKDLTSLRIVDQKLDNFIVTSRDGTSYYIGELNNDLSVLEGSYTKCTDIESLLEEPLPESRFYNGVWFCPVPYNEVTPEFEPSIEQIKAAIKPSALLDGPYTLNINKSPEQRIKESNAKKAQEYLVETYGTTIRDWNGSLIVIEGQVYNSPSGNFYVKGTISDNTEHVNLCNGWYKAKVVISSRSPLNRRRR